MESIINLIHRDPNVSPAFRAALPEPVECAECKVLAAVGHSPRCSKYVKPQPERYDATGFVRDSAGRIAGLNGGRY
jgi:hypothetical protein